MMLKNSMRFYALRMQETGIIRSKPTEDHRGGHGLELSQRTKARAEDLSGCIALITAIFYLCGPNAAS